MGSEVERVRHGSRTNRHRGLDGGGMGEGDRRRRNRVLVKGHCGHSCDTRLRSLCRAADDWVMHFHVPDQYSVYDAFSHL